eukprot:s636_g48.t1
MSRGGIADPDAPNCQESTKYWATTTTEHAIKDADTTSVAMSSNINPQHALQAFNTPLGRGVSPTVAVADPAALVREFASRAAAVTPQAAVADAPAGLARSMALTVPACGEIKKELSALGSLKLELPDLANRYGRYDEAMAQIDQLVTQLTLPDVTDEDGFARARSTMSGLVKARMLRASMEIKAWCKEHSKYRLPSRWHLSKTKLSLKRGKFVHYVGKGWHVSVILGFLRDFVENLNIDSDLKMLVWSGDELMSFLHAERQNRGLLLTDAGIHQATVLGDFHLKMLLVVSQKFSGFPTYRLFNVRPKFHSMSHVLDFASTGRNPVTQACWMEEDWIRKVANVAKRTHAKRTKLSTLQRYSAGGALTFGRYSFVIFVLGIPHWQD